MEPLERLDQVDHEVVDLCLGQRVGPLVLDRVLRREQTAGPGVGGYLRALRDARYAGGDGPTSRQRRELRRALAKAGGLSGRLRALWALPPRARD